MSRSLVIEEERGTTTGRVHPHNGYWAGDAAGSRAGSPYVRGSGRPALSAPRRDGEAR